MYTTLLQFKFNVMAVGGLVTEGASTSEANSINRVLTEYAGITTSMVKS